MTLTHCLEQRRRVIYQRVDTDELLEEHEAHSHVSATPATTLKAVSPGGNLELKPAGLGPRGVQMRVALSAEFLLEGDFSPNFEPFLLYAAIGGRQLAKFCEVDKGLLVPAFGDKPPG